MAELTPFARVLVDVRKRRGLSRSQLAERSSLSYPYISQLETGLRKPSRKANQQLAVALDVAPEVLEGAIPVDESVPELLEKADLHAYRTISSADLTSERPAPLLAAAASAPAPAGPLGRDDLVGQIVDLVEEVSADERLELLADVQKLTMQRMMRSGS